MGDYIKDAYKHVYSHSTWKKEAKQYEIRLAVSLYKNSYVQAAAKEALGKVSQVLTAYYGNLADTGKNTEERLDSARDLSEGIAQLSGQQTDSDVTQQAQGTQVQATKAQADQQAQQSSERGQAPTAAPASSILTRAFLNNSKTSAGQVGFSENEAENQQRVDEILNGDGNLREQMTMFFNASLFNAGTDKATTSQSVTLKRMFGEITPEQAQSDPALRSLDMVTIQELRKGDVYSINQMASVVGKKGIYSRLKSAPGFGSRVRRAEAKAGLGYDYYQDLGIGLSAREAALAAPDALKPAPAPDNAAPTDTQPAPTDAQPAPAKKASFYSRMKSFFSKKAPAPDANPAKQKAAPSGPALSWKEGRSYSRMDKDSSWVKERRRKGFRLITGPSGTTMRMLGTYKLLGASPEQLLAFRLALIAWMGSSQDHSLYEILYGSHQVGVKGKEDLSEAAKTYMSVDPLTIQQLRTLAGKEGQFPHEVVFNTMLNETAQARAAYSESGSASPLTGSSARPLQTAQDKALNIYTTGAYQIMNSSASYGNKLGWWFRSRNFRNRAEHLINKMQNDPNNVTADDLDIETIYEGSTPEELADEKVSQMIRRNIRVASALSMDALRERGQTQSVGEERDQGYVEPEARRGGQRARAHQYAKGQTYRGMGLFTLSNQFKQGNTFTLGTLTSTSRSRSQAKIFYDGVHSKFKKPVLLTFHLKNMGAVDISQVSNVTKEEEVLLPKGSRFEVTKGLYQDTQDPRNPINAAEVTEVGAPPAMADMIQENPQLAASIQAQAAPLEQAIDADQSGGAAVDFGAELAEHFKSAVRELLSNPSCLEAKNNILASYSGALMLNTPTAFAAYLSTLLTNDELNDLLEVSQAVSNGNLLMSFITKIDTNYPSQILAYYSDHQSDPKENLNEAANPQPTQTTQTTQSPAPQAAPPGTFSPEGVQAIVAMAEKLNSDLDYTTAAQILSDNPMTAGLLNDPAAFVRSLNGVLTAQEVESLTRLAQNDIDGLEFATQLAGCVTNHADQLTQ